MTGVLGRVPRQKERGFRDRGGNAPRRGALRVLLSSRMSTKQISRACFIHRNERGCGYFRGRVCINDLRLLCAVYRGWAI